MQSTHIQKNSEIMWHVREMQFIIIMIQYALGNTKQS